MELFVLSKNRVFFPNFDRIPKFPKFGEPEKTEKVFDHPV